MKADTEELRRALDAEAARASRDSRGCPAAEVVGRLSRQEASRAERMAFAEHLLTCPDCAVEYRLARSLDGLEREASTCSGDPRPAAPRREEARIPSRLAWAAAAGLAMAIGLTATWLLYRRAESISSQERGTTESTAAVGPPDGATLADPPAELTWTAVGGAEQYRVVLYDAESTPIWEAAALRQPRAPLSDAVRTQLSRGGDFYWRVEARERAERLSSRLYRFSVRRGG